MRAFNELYQTPATPVHNDTAIPATRSRFVVDHCLATHIARTTESFAFVPDLNSYQTYSILRSANEAWQHDKLPVLAVCAYSKSPAPFQKETGIQSDTADQFLSDLKFAHRMVPTLGASPAYIIRHYHSPKDKYDDVILPAHANLIVYQPQGLSDTQLTALFEHVANVRGKIILCGDRSDFGNSHSELTEAVERSISKAVPAQLRHLVEPSTQSTYLIWQSKTGEPADFPDGYRIVAKVQSDDIYRSLANSHYSGCRWTENPGVETFTRNIRSVQPGDIICHNGDVKCLGVDDVAKIRLLDSHVDRLQKQQFALDHPAPETPEPNRPQRKLKL